MPRHAKLTEGTVLPEMRRSSRRAPLTPHHFAAQVRTVSIDGGAVVASVDVALSAGAVGSSRGGGCIRVEAWDPADPQSAAPIASAVSELSACSASATLTLRIDSARPWSPTDPKLYDLCVSLAGEGVVADTYTLRTGFRTVQARAQGSRLARERASHRQGRRIPFIHPPIPPPLSQVRGDELLLNGAPLFLTGFGRHEDFPALGKGHCSAVSVKDNALVRWAGGNRRAARAQVPVRKSLSNCTSYMFLCRLCPCRPVLCPALRRSVQLPHEPLSVR